MARWIPSAISLVLALLVAAPTRAEKTSAEEKAAAHYKLGESYFKDGDYDSAIAEYEDCASRGCTAATRACAP